MAVNTSIADLFDVPPQPGVLGPLPLGPSQGQMNGLLAPPPAPQPTGGVQGGPFDRASLVGPAFDPMQVIAGGQGPRVPLLPLDGGWVRALQALTGSLRGASPSGLSDDAAGYGPAPAPAAASPPAPSAVRSPPPSPAVGAIAAGAPATDSIQGSDPSRPLAGSQPAGLVSIHVPSPHAGDYPTRDAAAKAGRSDIPPGSVDEYGTWLTQTEVPVTLPDIGKGPVPFLLDRFTYPGLITSNDPGNVVLGAAPTNAVGWMHNHPYDPNALGTDNENNIDPSPANNDGSRGDWYWAHLIQETTPDFATYNWVRTAC